MYTLRIEIERLDEPTIEMLRRLAGDHDAPIITRITAMSEQLAAVQAAVDDLAIKVARDTSVTQSAVTLITGLSDQLRQALADATSLGELRARIAGIADASDANTSALAASVAANTSAQPEQPQPEPQPEQPTPEPEPEQPVEEPAPVDPVPVDPTPTDPPIVDPAPTESTEDDHPTA